jgi:hypothetical protein
MMKPEEILTLVAAARGTAICVPTMTTSRWAASASWAAPPRWGSASRWARPIAG